MIAEKSRDREPLNILHMFLAAIKARHPLDPSAGFHNGIFDYSYLHHGPTLHLDGHS